VFDAIDTTALLQAAVARRLRGRVRLEDERERARLFRYLVGQGFEADRIMEALRALK